MSISSVLPLRRRFADRVASVFTPAQLAFAFTVLGAALRLYHITKLGLWFDEGGSIFLSHLPLSTILFNFTAYDTHPPLYPIVLKLFSHFLPEMYEGRLFSVVAGVLTIPVVYDLGRRLVGQRAGLVAAALLVISPLHVWYSQEERMYALVALLVPVSYLSLVGFYQEMRLRWVGLYFVVTLAALYLDYSAIYGLAPQLLIFLLLTRVHGRGSVPMWIGAAAVVVGYLPWVPQMFSTVTEMTQVRAPALGVSPEKIGGVIVSVSGLAGYQRYFFGAQPTPWEAWPQAQVFLGPALAIAAVGGALALWRRPAIAGLVVGGLFAGTLLVGAVISLYRPGFTERTVLSAVPGWCLLVGSVAALPISMPRQAWRALRAVAGAGAVVVVIGSGLALNAIYVGADKDHWSALFADLTRALPYQYPVVTFHPYVNALAGVYAPQVTEQNYTTILDPDGLSGFIDPGGERPEAFWLAYADLSPMDQIEARIRQDGYQRVLHDNYSQNSVIDIYLDLYAMPSAPVLQDYLPFNGGFAGSGDEATNWNLPAGHATLAPGTEGGRMLTLTNQQPGESLASIFVAAEPHGIYRVELDVQSRLSAGRVRGFLNCVSASGVFLDIEPGAAGIEVPADGLWHTVDISVDCPAGTHSLEVDLRNAGVGSVSFQNVRLQTLRLPGH